VDPKLDYWRGKRNPAIAMRTLLSLWPHPSVTLATQSRSGPHCLLTSWPFSLSFRVLSIVYHTAAMLLTFILIIISIPPPRHSFIPGLNLPFSANSSHCSLPFLLQDWLHGFPGLFTDTSHHIRLYMNKNILSCMNLQEDQSVSFLFFSERESLWISGTCHSCHPFSALGFQRIMGS